MIFVGGIHGVGKTHFCGKVAKELGINTYSAGKLISEEGNNNSRKDKRVDDIDGNQNYLLEAINKISDNDYLLDGHFCLLDQEGHIQRVPMRVFEDIKPQAIIILTEDPDIITNRLYARDGVKHNGMHIEEFQKEEIAYATEVASKLGIECLVYDSSDDLTLDIEVIKDIQKDKNQGGVEL